MDDVDADQQDARAVPLLVTMNEAGDASVGVLVLKSDGAIEDPGARVELPKNARAFALRPDGREAVVVYGTGASADKAAVFIEITDDFSGAEISQNLPLESQHSATSAVFTGDNSVALTMRGPADDFVLTLARDTMWQKGPQATCGAGPIALHRTAQTDEMMVLRTDFGGNFESMATPVKRASDGTWEVTGMPVDFAPYTINDVEVIGDRMYVPTEEPETKADLNPHGRIAVYERESAGSWTHRDTLLISDDAAQIAVSRDENVIVLNDAVKSLDPTGTVPIIERHDLVTVELDANGAMSEVIGERTPLGKELIRGMLFGPNETLVVAQSTAEGNLVRAFRRDGSAWSETGRAMLEASLTGLAVAD
jgi:hypothetical protein